jgi:peptidoglycan-associated lipoprotein
MEKYMKVSALRLSVCVSLLIFFTGLQACSHKAIKQDDQVASAASQDSQFKDLGSSDAGNAYGLKTVHFSYDSSLLGAEAKKLLVDDASILKQNAQIRIQVEGHCDQQGGIQYNLALGERRATAVKHYLSDHGVQIDRITTVSYGKEKLLDTSNTEEANAKNRRANLVITRAVM